MAMKPDDFLWGRRGNLTINWAILNERRRRDRAYELRNAGKAASEVAMLIRLVVAAWNG